MTKTKEQLIKDREKIQKQILEIEKKELHIEVPELKIRITKKQQFNGLKYKEILKQTDESKIATQKILQDLRNIAFDSNWKKYSFMKDFYVFVKNEDKCAVSNGYVARFNAGSDYVGLYTGGDSSCSGSDLGVFLFEKMESKK